MALLATMDQGVQICPRCGTPLRPGAPEGLCPVCLLVCAGAGDGLGEEQHDPGTVDRPLISGRPGPLWVGNYELLEELGHGGMGVVFKARQRGLNRIVAVKMVLAGRFSGPEAVARFRAEAQLAAQLQHPNIVAIHEVCEQEGEPFFSMDYIDGRNLAELVREHPLRALAAANYLETIAEAIHYAHQRGVLHRDLKPSNILIDRWDQPHITDFGLAKRLSEDSELTQTGQVLGSPSYAAPEQVMGWRERIRPAADVYSLGAVLYHLLVRRPPFIADTLAATARQVQEAEPVAVRRLNPTVPADLETICLKCLEKDPGQRYVTAEALAEDLRRFLRSEPILARPPGPAGRIARWCRRKPALATAVAALAGVAVLGTAAVLSQWRRAEANAAAEKVQRELAQKRLLVADTQLAYQAWDLDNRAAAQALLATHRSETNNHDFAWRYLWNRCQGEGTVLLRGHTRHVMQIAFSPDNRRLVSCDRAQVLTLWDLERRRPLWSLKGFIALGGFIAEGQALLASADLQSVSWLDLTDGRVRRTLPVEGLLLGVVKGGQSFVTTGTNFLLKLWDSRSGQLQAEVPGNQPYLGFADAVSRRIKFTPDGATLGICRFGKTNNVQIWNVERGLCQSVSTVPRPLALALTPDGTTWRAGCVGGQLYQGSSATNDCRVLSTLARPIVALAYSPDGSEFISGEEEEIVRRWNARSGGLIETCWGQINGTTVMAFSPDGELVATGSPNGTIQLWPRGLTPAVRINEGLRAGWMDLADQVALSPDGLTLAVVQGDRTVKLLSANGLRELATWPNAGFPVAFSDGGRHLLTVSGHIVRVWEVAQASLVREIACPVRVGRARIVLLAPSENELLFVGAFKSESDDDLAVCSVADGRERVSAHIAQARLTRVIFGADRPQVIGIDQEDNVYWWSTIDGRLLRTIAAHPAPPRVLSVAVRTGAFMDILAMNSSLQPAFPAALAQSPDGALLLTGGKDGSVKIWGTKGADPRLSLVSHRSAVTAATFSPDGRSFATADRSETIRLWNLDLGRETGSLTATTTAPGGTNGGIKRLLFTANGDVLIALNRQGQLKAWSVGTSKLR